ncbi:riboflavin synthase [Virgisporangium aurantiacum]|uniref:Riboflavin synthase n=1 Tax=Virgisporangium aurantiacum TaxID=175570 RepID=A0A8J3Z6Z0_9ACTN|nr:riboflavin synthase [Virgisporangium aurantiacum]GIJ58127.1 riboflavin synthase subunit alpha [Virgisporangium aurantiacum]
MFTGIVEELGTVVAVAADRLVLDGPLVTRDVAEGDSIAVNGVCLTVVAVDGGAFTADVMTETWKRSSLGELAEGDKVNLERAALPTTRLGGHLVQGHVDAVGTVEVREAGGAGWESVTFAAPPSLMRYIVEKGSITVDGVSLTVIGTGADRFSVGLIPTTLERTTLGRKQVGDPVNLEVDIIAKYVEKMVSSR